MSENAKFKSRLIAKLAATIVAAGALLAGLLLPWVGGTGLVARNSASLLHALPDELTDQTPAGNSRILAADNSLITNFYTNNRTPVAANKIADVMKQALVDIEDTRFYEHNGLDVQGTARALVTNLAAGKVQEGGSTITQQLVKQTLLQTATTSAERNAAIEQSGVQGLSRKLKEARLALALEEKYSDQDPGQVAEELAVEAETTAEVFDSVRPDQRARPGRRSNGSAFTVESFAVYFLHDIEHHLDDVSR